MLVSAADLQRRTEVELLRIISAFGIVWFHTSALGKDIAYSGLIVFLILSTYFSTKPSLKTKPLLERVKKILIPWMVWLFFYGAINVFMKRPFINTNNGYCSSILAGTSIHLWYMPFIFMVIILFDGIRKYVNPQILAYICFILILLKFVTIGLWVAWADDLKPPYGQYFHAANGVLIGVFLANSIHLSKLFQAGVLFVVLSAIVMSASVIPSSVLPYCIGILISSLVLIPTWNFISNIKVNWLSECTLGIYLSHPFWFLVVNKFGLSSEIITPILVFTISTISVLLMKKILPKIFKYVA